MPWEFADNLPIYAQLVELLKQKIVTGEYPPGGKLPSVRDLAAEAAVNPNTVQRALSELERGGLIYTQRTAGKYVTDDAPAIAEARHQLAETQIRAFLAAMHAMGYSYDETVAMLHQAVDAIQEEMKKEEDSHADPAM